MSFFADAVCLGIVHNGIVPVFIALIIQVNVTLLVIDTDGSVSIDQLDTFLLNGFIVIIGLIDPFIDRLIPHKALRPVGDGLHIHSGIGTGFQQEIDQLNVGICISIPGIVGTHHQINGCSLFTQRYGHLIILHSVMLGTVSTDTGGSGLVHNHIAEERSDLSTVFAGIAGIADEIIRDQVVVDQNTGHGVTDEPGSLIKAAVLTQTAVQNQRRFCRYGGRFGSGFGGRFCGRLRSGFCCRCFGRGLLALAAAKQLHRH